MAAWTSRCRPRRQDYHKRLTAFMTEFVFPAEEEYDRVPARKRAPTTTRCRRSSRTSRRWPRSAGCGTCFLPADVRGLTNLEYAPLAELTGWSLEIAPEVTNCAAPDTGNMETLHLFATEAQTQAVAGAAAGRRDPQRLLDDRACGGLQRRPQHRNARSPATAATTSSTAASGGSTGASDPRCKVLIVMGRTNPDAASHQQQSMVLVPIDTPGVTTHAVDAGVRLAGPARALRDRLRQRAGAGGEPARRGGRRVRDRAGPALARAASTTACARSGRPSGRWR